MHAMFDRIAGRYDLMNSVMTAGLHHRWRQRAVEMTGLRAGDRALDVCTGTGDLALELRERVGAAGEVVGCDFSAPMLEQAREKASVRGVDVSFEEANALALPYPGARFDAATVGFGVRNVEDLERGLAELARVVRPGGRVVILEITTPMRRPLSTFYGLWFDRVVPALGRVAGDSDAYSYLPASVRRFPGPVQLCELLAGAGLTDIRYVLLAGGIIAIHSGRVPEGPARPVAGAEAPSAPLAAVLERGGPRLAGLLAGAEERLGEIAASHGKALAASAGATLEAGGKRLRPLLVFLCGGESGSEELVRAAVAVELVHMATLVHDDVLDGAALRRGRATVFATSGPGVAAATGDFLFSRAFAELRVNGSAAQVRALGEASLGLARGELWQRQDAFDPDVSEERYLRRCELKTGRLFQAACVLGVLAGDVPDAAAPHVAAYGRQLGLAFQILDDVLDLTGSPQVTGKRRGTDLLDGTVTLPLILALRERPALRDALRAPPPEAELDAIVAEVVQSGAIPAARERALVLVAEAKALVRGHVGAAQLETLELVADGAVERYS